MIDPEDPIVVEVHLPRETLEKALGLHPLDDDVDSLPVSGLRRQLKAINYELAKHFGQHDPATRGLQGVMMLRQQASGKSTRELVENPSADVDLEIIPKFRVKNSSPGHEIGRLVSAGLGGVTLVFPDERRGTFSWSQVEPELTPSCLACRTDHGPRARCPAMEALRKQRDGYARDLLSVQGALAVKTNVVSRLGESMRAETDAHVEERDRLRKMIQNAVHEVGRVLPQEYPVLDLADRINRLGEELMTHRTAHQLIREVAGDMGADELVDCVRALRSRYNVTQERLGDAVKQLNELGWVEDVGGWVFSPSKSSRWCEECQAIVPEGTDLLHFGASAGSRVPPSARRSSGPAESASPTAPAGAPIAAARDEREEGDRTVVSVADLEKIRSWVARANHLINEQSLSHRDLSRAQGVLDALLEGTPNQDD